MIANDFAAKFLEGLDRETQLVLMSAISIDAAGAMLEEKCGMSQTDVGALFAPVSTAINRGIPPKKMKEIHKLYKDLKKGLARCDR